MALVSVEQIKSRTKQFSLRIVFMYQKLPKVDEARVIGKQVLRSGTSVGANYRAACRARSDKEFLAKIGVVIEEADETAFWLELLAEANIVPAAKLGDLLQETNELLVIFGATQRTLRNRLKAAKSKAKPATAK